MVSGENFEMYSNETQLCSPVQVSYLLLPAEPLL